MKPRWEVVDTGLRGATENLAYDRALLEAREAGEIGNTLRFLRFTPSALVGYHQSVEQELDLDSCAALGIQVQRRITGGGAIYFDEGQLGWELFLSQDAFPSADRDRISRLVCEAAAAGIRSFGVDARFRPRNDIEVAGKKISGTGGIWERKSLMYQGTLLLDFDVEQMLRILRIPVEKLRDKAIASARERVTCFRELLGDVPPLERVQTVLADAFGAAFGVEFSAAELPGVVKDRYRKVLQEMAGDEWINLVAKPRSEAPLLEAMGKFPGGLLRAALAYDRRSRLVKQVWFTGDFFANPPRLINDLEAQLKNVSSCEVEEKIRLFLADCPADALSLSADEMIGVVRQALDGTL